MLKNKKTLCAALLVSAISGCAKPAPPPPAIDLCTLILDRGRVSWFCVNTKTGVEQDKDLADVRMGVSVRDYQKMKDYEAELVKWGRDNCQVNK